MIYLKRSGTNSIGSAKQAEEFIDDDRHEEAKGKLTEALALLPPPVDQWEAVIWIYGTLGDIQWESADYSDALQSFDHAIRCGGADNPFLRLRAGQCCVELGMADEAAEHLVSAFISGGARIFGTEDAKYYTFLKDAVPPPVHGGWPELEGREQE